MLFRNAVLYLQGPLVGIDASKYYLPPMIVMLLWVTDMQTLVCYPANNCLFILIAA